jgi:uncharacterized phiE125 gp8 family phage protein
MRAQKPERVTAPATALITLAEVKQYLRIEEDEIAEDLLLGSLILSATNTLDGYSGLLGRALVDQQWRQRFSDFPEGDLLPLPLGTVRTPPVVTYRDTLGGEQSFTAFHLVTTALGPAIELQDGATWPQTATRPDAVTVTWTAGYGPAPADVPEIFRTAALQLIAHWYGTRETVNVGNIVTEVPWGLRQTIAAMGAVTG